ncbi:Nephrocystin-3 [Xenopus laevis] [Rhizoctonia solani]|uniref:Nephrocystin-3 [Xenopus laevis] n=1 Tax=Rhizoctonia solani TaxID=456999 RepID=A0A0K6G3Z6_9AGAM|nr:Nephrocystin-3 [Xenopus laevis] [Rhizoctonia solani]
MRTVFSERKYTLKGDTGAFKASVLESELKRMIESIVGDKDEKMVQEEQANESTRCRVIVYAMSSYNLTSALPVAFRCYPSTTTPTKCTIWEALRASTSHPQMFKPIHVDVEGTGLRNMFTHGGLGCANPTPRLLEEAKQVYPDRGVASITSIGTGHPRIIQIAAGRNRTSWRLGESITVKVMQAAHEMAEGSERVAEEMARRFTEVGSVYYRLNVQQGAQGVDASEWECLDEIAAHTRAYLNQTEIASKLNKLAEAILQRMLVLDTAHIEGRALYTSELVQGGIRACPLPSARFVGREDRREMVRLYFTRASEGRHVFVLYGLGGAGKTQVALKCVEELKDRFLHTIFVDASSDDSIQASLANVAIRNKLGKTYEDMLQWICRQGRSCLLVLDNADDPKLKLQAYLPQSADHNVLITTRCPEFAALAVGRTAACNVSGLEESEAVDLLLETARLNLEEMSETQIAVMYQLLKSFDYLALAVVQSGAYIWKMKLSVSQYWEKYSKRQQKIPEGNVVSTLGLDGYAKTVYTTWELSLDQLSTHAQELLFLVAFLHRDGILEAMFLRAAQNKDNYEPDMPLSPEQFAVEERVKQFLNHLVDNGNPNDAFSEYIGELLSLSLVAYDQVLQAYSIHPLVQGWAQIAASRRAISLQHSALLLALSIGWGMNNTDHLYKRQVLPHVNLIVEQNQVYDSSTADRFAEVYRACGQLRSEEALREHITCTRKKQLGEDHPRTLTSMGSLAVVYKKQGKTAMAKKLQVIALVAQRRILGDKHPDTLKTMHELGWTHYTQRQYSDAEKLLTTVVTAREEILEQNHPDTLESIDDLASIYESQSRLAHAEALRMKVMAARKRTLGEDHPDTLEGMDNLANTYNAQGRLTEAEALHVAVIAARKRVLGDEHPDTLISMHNLAYVHQLQGQWENAEALFTITVATMKRVLGEDHPDTLSNMHNLAYTHQMRGRLEDAEALYSNVIAIEKRVFGEVHPETLHSMHNLAYAHQLQGQLENAEALYTTVVAAKKQVLGEDHPDTLHSMHNLAAMHQLRGRLEDAEALYAIVVAARKRVLGDDHPDTYTSQANLACTYYSQRRFIEAQALYTAILDSQRRVLGSAYPATIQTMQDLENTYSMLGKAAECDALRAERLAISSDVAS